MHTDNSSEQCTRDPEAIKRGEADPLLRQKGSLRGIADMLSGGESLKHASEAGKLTLPVLLVHGTGDIVTSHDASREWFSKVKSTDKTHHEYKDYYHEPHNDLGRDRPIADCIAWIEARSATTDRPASSSAAKL